jgi:hypothetical protein
MERLHARFEMKRIDHQVAYASTAVCTNQAGKLLQTQNP